MTKVNGGSVKVELGYGIAVNKGSSLNREWIAINDADLPLKIKGTPGVQAIYDAGKKYSNGSFKFVAAYTVSADEELTAVEVRFLTFDVWGDHIRTLTATDVIDLKAGETKSLDGEWRVYSDNDIIEYYASIAYVAQVRTKDGRVLKANANAVLEEAKKFSAKFAMTDLEPIAEK
ncbi:hypothetical protein ACFO5Q_13670 [Kordiimonas lipolytica]|uniref:Phage tail protein n=1 Tax=Kordiimonas lipolytica TaxID=1662421 RepID=A0ABV8UDY5_9PROT|nr:hypothetical protein [Kordiimonas lipolytica]